MADSKSSNRHTHAAERFSIGEARRIVSDLFEPRPVLYWIDFLCSIGVGYACYQAVQGPRLIPWLTHLAGWPSPLATWSLRAVFFAISVLAIYRASLFTHELAHLREGAVRGFRPVWNFLCGAPFLMPSFMYDTHAHHHVRRIYGTPQDGEYLPFARRSVWAMLGYLAQSFVLPFVAVARFGLISPLSWLSPRLRKLAQERFSSLVINYDFVRPRLTASEARAARRQEAGCVIVIWGAAALLLAGVLPWSWLLQAYATGCCVILLNAVRTLGAHRYRGDGRDMTVLEQLVDSINYPAGRWIDELWAPVGLRFHALHHLFPGMPYHNLATAHRRLLEQLPPDSPYREASSPRLSSSLATLFADAATGRIDRIDRGNPSPTGPRGGREFANKSGKARAVR